MRKLRVETNHNGGEQIGPSKNKRPLKKEAGV